MAVEMDFYARQLSLIKFARSLEQDRTKSLDEKINELWPLLCAARDGKSCAAEESILRWFLKNMNGGTEDAERVRRYPLTWTILGCLFERISLFSLSSIFSDRHFISVLQQSVKDVSKPSKTGDPETMVNGDVKSKKKHKRKRDDPITFDLENLRSPKTFVESATELFNTMDRLLARVNGPMGQRAEDVTVGAEHVKALFRTPATVSKELVASLLNICQRSLTLLENGLSADQLKWIRVTISIWNLRLGSQEDYVTFATHLYLPSLFILSQLRNAPSPSAVEEHQDVKRIWIRQLEQLLNKNVVSPARTNFGNNSGMHILTSAHLVAMNFPHPHVVSTSSQILWDLAVKTRQDANGAAARKLRVSWIHGVFTYLEESLEETHNADATVFSSMLDSAIQSNSSLDVDTLRNLCRKYGFASKDTDWPLIVKVLRCDPNVFLFNDETLNDLLNRITSSTDNRDMIVEGAIIPLMESFSTERELTEFAKKWHAELSQSEASGASLSQIAWFDTRIRFRFSSLMQDKLSTQQLLELLDELCGGDNFTSGATLIILDAVCDGINDEDYDQLGFRVFQAAFHEAKSRPPSEIAALKWRVAGKTASQITSDLTQQMWDKVRKSLADLLTKGQLSDMATLEAFGCCCQLWLAEYSDGANEAKLSRLICSVLQRVVSQVEKTGECDALFHFLDLAFSCRLAEGSGKEPLELVSRLFRVFNTRFDSKNQHLISKLLRGSDFEEVISEPLEAALVAPIITDLEEHGWTHKSVSTLLDFPLQNFIRERRRRIMSSWKNWKSNITSHAASDAEYAKNVLYLVLMVTQRPTFYQDMTFDDIVDFSLNMPRSPETISLLDEEVELTITQLAVNYDDSLSSYFQGVSQYVKNVDVESDDKTIHLGLLMGIVRGLRTGTTAKSSSLSVLLNKVTQKLREVVQQNVSQFASDWKKNEKSLTDNESLLSISRTLNAAKPIKEDISVRPLKLSSKTVERLSKAAEHLAGRGLDAGWKLRAFLVRNRNGTVETTLLIDQLSHSYPTIPDKSSVSDLVDATLENCDDTTKLHLLKKLIGIIETQKYSSVTLMAVMGVLERIQTSEADLAAVEISLANLLEDVSCGDQFEIVAQAVNHLLDKHPGSMTQSSVDFTTACIATVCSPRGPKLSDSHAASGVFKGVFQIMATIIKRHRLRLEGHHHLLVGALQALLRVVLVDPQLSEQSSDIKVHPAWLDSRLKATHAAQFTRLITMVCEPSAASVAYSRKNDLDSATNAVKRSAGQYMYWVLVLYIKLQSEDVVSRDPEIGKALKPGVYSILNITPEGSLKMLNEALDASGRAIFSTMYRDYKKFGKWTGV